MSKNYNCKLTENCQHFSVLKDKFSKLGENRFKRFAENQAKDILCIGKDATLLKAFFRAAGYKKNQANFLELFDRFMKYPLEMREIYYETILWGESDLLPEPATGQIHTGLHSFFNKIWDQWWRIRIAEKTNIPWIKHGIRPQNYPERRIAAICNFIKKHGLNSFNKFHDEINNAYDIKVFEKHIYNTIQQSDELWDNFYNFKKETPNKTVVFGKNRANDFIINGLLPTLYAQTLLPQNDNKKHYSKSLNDRSKALNLWLTMNNSVKNNITIEVAERCNLNLEQLKIIAKSNVCNQGAIELYKEYCSPCLKDCARCKINI